MVGWLGNALGLPGNWLAVCLGLCCFWLAAPDSGLFVSLPMLALLVVLALAGEVVELAAGSLGVQRLGGSSRGIWLSLAGSMLGALLGLFLGTGLPVVGNVIGCLMGSALGACGGAILGERSLGRPLEHSLQIGGAAFWGRLVGTLGKVILGTAIVLAFMTAIWL